MNGKKEDMEIMSSSISSENKSLGEHLINGDKVVCIKCHEGIYVPAFPEAKIKHDFYCNKCGDKVHLDANVIVE